MESNKAAALSENRSLELDELNEVISKLEEQLKVLEEEAQFLEAERVYQRILDLKATQKKQQQKQLKVKQTEERAGIESQHTAEFKEFSDEWELRFNKYTEGCEKIEADLKQQQTTDFETTKAGLEAKLFSLAPKYSTEYLNLQRILKTVVKNKDYREAHAIQTRLSDLADVEKEHWRQQQQIKVDHQLAKLKKTHQKELGSLRKRAENGLNELNKQRSEEYETLIKKYQNREKTTSSTQTKELKALLKLSVPGVASLILSQRPSSARLGRVSASPGGSPPKTSSKAP